MNSAAPAVPPAASSASAAQAATPAEPSCPEGMQHIAGGEFWSGSSASHGPKNQHPRFRTRVHDFCLDRTEVTVAAYASCEQAGQCTTAARKTKTCNGGREARGQHPINCTSWEQADAYCRSQGKRLPTELEWEYAARGGAEYRKFSWGDASPDGNTCWKSSGTCEVASFTVGAFGLHDMNGNVWEWTDTFYGSYPWPPRVSPTKIYRGGSWSRRFDKWLSLTLRNRYGPDKWGSHLGFRCAKLAAGSSCPYGDGAEGFCLHGVEEAACQGRLRWNGVRCARPDQPAREDGCASGTHKEPGLGCVLDETVSHAVSSAAADPKAGVRLRRSPTFDSDCLTHQPERPHAYRLSGGTHHGRNLVGRAQGCKNRDVGVGWNSACCP